MRRHVFLLLAAMLSSTLYAQSTKDALRARLLHQPLYLRGLWRGDTLYFDSTGQPAKSYKTLPFTLAGVDIDNVVLKSDRLILEGQRIGLIFQGQGAKRMALAEVTHLEIARPPDGDYAVPLGVILSAKLSDLAINVPFFWESFAYEHLLSPADRPVTATASPTGNAEKIGGAVTRPLVLRAPMPIGENDVLEKFKLKGTSLLHLVVDTDGRPTQISIVRPLGLGLDESAVAAVQQYKFAPATRDGQPVAVEMQIEIGFESHTEMH